MRYPDPTSVIIFIICVSGAALAATPSANAAGIVWEVTRADDIATFNCPSADQCTLRGAVVAARDEDAIFFSPSLGTSIVIELQQTLVVDKDIEIAGPGSDRLAIRPAGPFRPLVVRARDADSSARVLLTDLTIRDGVVSGAAGAAGSSSGAHGTPGGEAQGGCLLVDNAFGSASAQLLRVALRNCTVVGGDGGNGAGGLDVDRGAGGSGGDGASGGAARGAAIAVLGSTGLYLASSSVSESFAIGGKGGSGGRGGGGSLSGGAGGSGGRGGDAEGGGVASPSSVYVQSSSFLGNGLSGGSGGAGGAGGRSTGLFGTPGAAGPDAPAGDLAGGNIHKSLAGILELDHATLGPTVLEQGTPGNWDGASDAGRGTVQGEVVFASAWRVRATALIGTSPHSLCGGNPPQFWSGSGTSAASSNLCLQDKSMSTNAGTFVGDMAATFESGRAVATPMWNSRLIDALAGCSPTLDQSGRPRPLDGDNDGVAACDIGAVEVMYSPAVFADGFER